MQHGNGADLHDSQAANGEQYNNRKNHYRLEGISAGVNSFAEDVEKQPKDIYERQQDQQIHRHGHPIVQEQKPRPKIIKHLYGNHRGGGRQRPESQREFANHRQQEENSTHEKRRQIAQISIACPSDGKHSY